MWERNKPRGLVGRSSGVWEGDMVGLLRADMRSASWENAPKRGGMDRTVGSHGYYFVFPRAWVKFQQNP